MPNGTLPFEQIVQFLAVGLVQQQSVIESNQQQPVTQLNPFIQQAWEQIHAACLEAGLPSPVTLKEFIVWLHRPIDQWPAFGEAASRQGYTSSLLENGMPTPLCENISRPFVNAPDPYLEIGDSPFKEMMVAARGIDDPEQYARAREFLNRNPILEDTYASIHADPGWESTIRECLSQCYQAVSRSCIRTEPDGKYIYLCPHCGWILDWKGDEAICHKGGICARIHGDLASFAEKRRYVLGLVCTTEGIQRYVVAPEIELIRIHDILSREWGVICHLFPNFDQFDLLIEFAHGRRWAIDLKDHESASKLARYVNEKPFIWNRQWDRAFYVFPDYRVTPGYLNTFNTLWSAQRNVAVMSVSKFLKLARKELNR